jgi:hypothetical protein
MHVYSTPFEIIQFYYFWLWEYQRRNEEYVKGNALAEDYNRKTGNIESPKKGLTSEYILKRALNNKDIIEGKKGFFDYYYSNISSLLDATGVVLTKEPDSNNKITAEIDISRPFESVLQGVRYYHKCYQDSSSIDEGRRQGESEKGADGLLNLLKFLFENNKPKNFKVNINVLPRAIGLWMWDYIKANNLTDHEERWVKATKAYKIFLLKREGYTGEKIKIILGDKKPTKEKDKSTVNIYIDTALRKTGLTGDDSTLRKYYDNAEDSIRGMKILPIK